MKDMINGGQLGFLRDVFYRIGRKKPFNPNLKFVAKHMVEPVMMN